MKKLNIDSRGFTFVEILAVVAIMGILSGIAIAGVSRYRQKQIQNNYDALAQSGYEGFKSYVMKYGDVDSVSFQELKDGNFISNALDPLNKGNDCEGVIINQKEEGNNGKLDSYNYWVKLCCSNYKMMYKYPSGDKVPIKNCENSDTVCKINLSNDGWTNSDVTASIDLSEVANGGISKDSYDDAKTYSSSSITYSNNGQHNVYGYVDNGIKGTSCSASVKIDKVYPTVTLEVVSSTSGYKSNVVNYKIDASDSLSGISKYCIVSDKNSCIPNSSTSASTLKVSDTLDGSTHKLVACASDIAGNVGCSSVINYTVYKNCSNVVENSTCGKYHSNDGAKCGNFNIYADKTVTKVDSNTGSSCGSEVIKDGCIDKHNSYCKSALTLFRIKYKDKDCDNYKRHYYMNKYYCLCNYNNSGVYQNSTVTDISKTSATIFNGVTYSPHTTTNNTYFTVEYDHDSSGKNACNGSWAVNSYVKKVCTNGDVDAMDSYLVFHGAVFYNRAYNHNIAEGNPYGPYYHRSGSSDMFDKNWYIQNGYDGTILPDGSHKSIALQNYQDNLVPVSGNDVNSACDKYCRFYFPNAEYFK